MAKAKWKTAEPFKVGDKIVARFGSSEVLTVAWVSRNATSREGQLIKTSEGYCANAREADGYEVAP